MSGRKGPLTQWHSPKSTGKIHLQQVLCLRQMSKKECRICDRFTIEYYLGIQLTAVKTETVSAISLVHYQEWQTVKRVTSFDDSQVHPAVGVGLQLLGEVMRHCVGVSEWLIIIEVGVMLQVSLSVRLGSRPAPGRAHPFAGWRALGQDCSLSKIPSYL